MARLSTKEIENIRKYLTVAGMDTLNDLLDTIESQQQEIEKLKLQATLNKLRDEIHANAVEHGWWEEERSLGEIIALCHSELSEALEEYRNGHEPNEIYFLNGKPEGIPVELADCIIRIMDYCGRKEIDIDGAIRLKHEYNRTRPYRHGGKRI